MKSFWNQNVWTQFRDKFMPNVSASVDNHMLSGAEKKHMLSKFTDILKPIHLLTCLAFKDT